MMTTEKPYIPGQSCVHRLYFAILFRYAKEEYNLYRTINMPACYIECIALEEEATIINHLIVYSGILITFFIVIRGHLQRS